MDRDAARIEELLALLEAENSEDLQILADEINQIAKDGENYAY